MTDPAFNTVLLQECLGRWQAGDRDAADDLLRAVSTRLTKLAGKMIRAFPNVRGLADTDDVLQNSLVRLFRTLRNLRPATPRDFFNLAAVHIRRELLDLARRARGKDTVPLLVGSTDSPQGGHEPAAPVATAPMIGMNTPRNTSVASGMASGTWRIPSAVPMTTASTAATMAVART